MTKVLSFDIGRLNLGVCAIELGSDSTKAPRLVDLRCVRLADAGSAPATAVVDRFLQFIDEEYEVLGSWSPDVVLLEQQMASAPINTALAFSAYALFRSRGIECRMVRARDKFGAFARHPFFLASPGSPSPVPPPETYHARKRASIALADALLGIMGHRGVRTFPGCGEGGKADDGADAFLQTFLAGGC